MWFLLGLKFDQGYPIFPNISVSNTVIPGQLRRLLDDDRREWLDLAIQKLPDAQRVPLVLFHFQDLSYDEIAEKLGISLAKVKTDIHRGRESLRKILVKTS